MYTVPQDLLILSRTVVSRYYNCSTDGSTSPGNYRFPPVPKIGVNVALFAEDTCLNEHNARKAVFSEI
jgi:hypothetical protein